MITQLYSNCTQHITSLFNSAFRSYISYFEEGRWVQKACLLLSESAVHRHSFGNHDLLLLTISQDSCKFSPLNVHVAYGIEMPYWWEACERYVSRYCIHNIMKMIKRVCLLIEVAVQFHVEFFSNLNHILSTTSLSPAIRIISLQESDSWSFL